MKCKPSKNLPAKQVFCPVALYSICLEKCLECKHSSHDRLPKHPISPKQNGPSPEANPPRSTRHEETNLPIVCSVGKPMGTFEPLQDWSQQRVSVTSNPYPRTTA